MYFIFYKNNVIKPILIIINFKNIIHNIRQTSDSYIYHGQLLSIKNIRYILGYIYIPYLIQHFITGLLHRLHNKQTFYTTNEL